MEIVFIRHGDPNYELDALTEKGILEAKALIPRVEKMNADYYYVSPLGRARQTAQIAMERINKEAKVLDWLREFPAVVKHICEPNPGPQCWDWMPSDWAKEPSFYDIDHFYDHPVMANGHVEEIYEDVLRHFDALLRKHGYAKNGKTFDVLEANHDTLCFLLPFRYRVCLIILSDQCLADDPVAWLCRFDFFGDDRQYRRAAEGYCQFPHQSLR